MDTPQEVEVWFVLPALRRQYVLFLKENGLKQKEIANLMNLTEAAVSQYLKKKRGDAITFTKEILDEIRNSVKKITLNKADYRCEFQKMLKKLKQSRFICSVCHEHTDNKDNCEICGLYKSCNSPKMGATGQGRKKILIWGEGSGEKEDTVKMGGIKSRTGKKT